MASIFGDISPFENNALLHNQKQGAKSSGKHQMLRAKKNRLLPRFKVT